MSHANGTVNENNAASEITPETDNFCYDDPFKGNLFSRRVRYFENRSNIHWSIPWSDLMMTMFIMFAVMFIYQMANRDFSFGKGPGVTTVSDSGSGLVMNDNVKRVVSESFPDIYDLSRETIKDLASVELIEDKAVRITLTNDLLFEVGKADLKPGAKEVLGNVALVIQQTSYMVNVVGHTDNVPIKTDEFPTNWELSAIRACVVARYLMENHRLPGERFFISGHSYHQPLNSNITSENRIRNRRVEIIITKGRLDGF
ncbi:MAG: flagellar motor protein MotB [Desulfobacteraceae bacterium]|nr:flagellar motor protein MotB [Desulfobacteraceae bacterium]